MSSRSFTRETLAAGPERYRPSVTALARHRHQVPCVGVATQNHADPFRVAGVSKYVSNDPIIIGLTAKNAGNHNPRVGGSSPSSGTSCLALGCGFAALRRGPASRTLSQLCPETGTKSE